MVSLFIATIYSIIACMQVAAFTLPSIAKTRSSSRQQKLQMIEVEMNTATYVGILVVTLIPSLAFVKFVGDQADSSKEKLSEKQKASFKKSMMEQPGANIGIPSSEEESLKKQIAKAYMQDKDVDVAVLEEKLKVRAQWRKEILAQQKEVSANEDEDGW
jgi:hypothetical protein